MVGTWKWHKPRAKPPISLASSRLSGQKEKRWQNPTKGGNRTGDFSQLYLECKPFDFQSLASALEHTRPGLMEDAVRAWRSKQGSA